MIKTEIIEMPAKVRGGETLQDLIGEYMASPRYRRLAKSTKREYRSILGRFLKGREDMSPATLDRRHMNAVLGGMVETPTAANKLLKRLKTVMGFAVETGMIEANPLTPMKKPYEENPEGYHTWTDDEIERFRGRHGAGTAPRLAMELMLHTGVRRSDAARMGWADVDEGMILVRQQKTSKRLLIPIHPVLWQHLKDLDRDAPAFLMNGHGRPFTPAGTGARMRKWCDRAGLSDCTSHGLRKACTTRLAEAGTPDPEIMAVTGHTDPSQVSVYVRAANQKRLAVRAMNRIGGTADPTSGPALAHMAFGIREASLAASLDGIAGRTRTPSPTPWVAVPDAGGGRPGGTRTPNQSVMSALL